MRKLCNASKYVVLLICLRLASAGPCTADDHRGTVLLYIHIYTHTFADSRLLGGRSSRQEIVSVISYSSCG